MHTNARRLTIMRQQEQQQVPQQPGQDQPQQQRQVDRVVTEFTRLIQEAVQQKKFGHFGLIVSVQSGAIKTFQKHDIETMK